MRKDGDGWLAGLNTTDPYRTLKICAANVSVIFDIFIFIGNYMNF